jgi:RNA recognition motif-containing protein
MAKGDRRGERDRSRSRDRSRRDRSRSRDRYDRYDRYDRRDRDRDRDRRDRSSRFPPPQRTKYRLYVTNLAPHTDWRDLKDMFREGGQVNFADILRGRVGVGIVEFENEDGQKAGAKFDGRELKGQAIKVSEVRIIKLDFAIFGQLHIWPFALANTFSECIPFGILEYTNKF